MFFTFDYVLEIETTSEYQLFYPSLLYNKMYLTSMTRTKYSKRQQ